MSRKIKQIEYVGSEGWIDLAVRCEDDSLWVFACNRWRRLPNIPSEKEDNVYLKDRIWQLEKVLSLLGIERDDTMPMSEFHQPRKFIIEELNIAKDKLEE